MLARILSALSVPLAFGASIGTAKSACGQGMVPTYGDIAAIQYERTNCFGSCQNYQVLFSNDRECYYVGIRNVSRRGTYQGGCSKVVFKRLIDVLAGHDFYSINYNSAVLVLDAPHYVISVQRCGVTTKLDWPVHGARKDIESLFDALDVVTNEISWHKISSRKLQPL